MQSGESIHALKALDAQSLFNDVSEDEAYYYLLSKARLKLGDYALAYCALHKYSEISDSLDMVKMSQEVKSEEEKYEKNLLIRRQRLTICVAALILIFFMTIFIIYVLKRKSSEERLRRKYNDLKDEYEFLKKAQERILPEADEEAHRILERRIKALGHFLSKDTPDSLSKVADKLEDLTADKNTVTDSIGMLYAIYHPSFVLKLEEYGLTASEVGFCCLLVLGLKTSELSMVVNKSNTYNISSRIRTIAENIALCDGMPDMKRVRRAAELANIKDWIENLPLGYNTKIGADGHGVSTGQKPRILIARAAYKNSPYIFFDEATNSLDANNEKVIMENLKGLFEGKTVVVVAHRLSTVKNADNILVIDSGRIIEDGTHSELIARKGRYYELVRNQLELGN